MKKLLIMALFISYCVLSFGQLTEKSQKIRTEKPKVYNEIKAKAVSKWGSDNEMIVYTINKQVDALYIFMDYLKKSENDNALTRIVVEAVQKWGEKETEAEGGGYKNVDYEMVVYEIEQQLKNSDY